MAEAAACELRLLVHTGPPLTPRPPAIPPPSTPLPSSVSASATSAVSHADAAAADALAAVDAVSTAPMLIGQHMHGAASTIESPVAACKQAAFIVQECKSIVQLLCAAGISLQ